MHQGAVTESSTGFTFKSITLPDMQNSLFLNNTDGEKKDNENTNKSCYVAPLYS